MRRDHSPVSGVGTVKNEIPPKLSDRELLVSAQPQQYKYSKLEDESGEGSIKWNKIGDSFVFNYYDYFPYFSNWLKPRVYLIPTGYYHTAFQNERDNNNNNNNNNNINNYDEMKKRVICQVCMKGDATAFLELINTNTKVPPYCIWWVKDVAMAKVLLERGAKEDLKKIKEGKRPNWTKEGRSPLLEAIINNNFELASLLLENGFPANFQDQYETALFRECAEGNYEMAKLLVDHGADVNWLSFKEVYPIMEAAHARPYQYRIASKDDPKFQPMEGKEEERGYVEIIKMMIENGASPYSVQMALCIACCEGNLLIIDYLLSCGVPLHSTMPQASPLMFAIMEMCPKAGKNKFHMQVIQTLLKRLNQSLEMIRMFAKFAALKGEWEVLDTVLKVGVDVNERDEMGISVLQFAAVHKSDPSKLNDCWSPIQTMLDHYGGSVKGENGGYKNSLLYFAVCGGNVVVVEELLKRGVDPNLPGVANVCTPIIHAIASSSIAIARILIKYGAKYDVSQWGGIYKKALLTVDLDLVKELIDMGMPLNPNKGLVPVDFFSSFYTPSVNTKDSDEFVQCLLANGAKPTYKMLSDVVVCNNAALYGSNASQNKRPSNETVKMILEKCPLNVVRKYEPTSFLFKHYHGQYDMIIALLDAGNSSTFVEFLSKIRLRPNERKKEDDELLFRFIICGADPSKQWTDYDHKKKTCFDFMKGNQHVIDIMKKGMNSKWTPDIHHMFPRHIRYTITVALLVARRNHWPFDKSVIYHILSFIAVPSELGE